MQFESCPHFSLQRYSEMILARNVSGDKSKTETTLTTSKTRPPMSPQQTKKQTNKQPNKERRKTETNNQTNKERNKQQTKPNQTKPNQTIIKPSKQPCSHPHTSRRCISDCTSTAFCSSAFIWSCLWYYGGLGIELVLSVLSLSRTLSWALMVAMLA